MILNNQKIFKQSLFILISVLLVASIGINIFLFIKNNNSRRNKIGFNSVLTVNVNITQNQPKEIEQLKLPFDAGINYTVSDVLKQYSNWFKLKSYAIGDFLEAIYLYQNGYNQWLAGDANNNWILYIKKNNNWIKQTEGISNSFVNSKESLIMFDYEKNN